MHPATIGPFQIQRELGRGGMGEVYLARDTRLDRQAAIKALPAHLASDPDRLARFQREAKVLASLSDSGIGAIYGLEEAAGQQFLILEYVEGQTLADRLTDGAVRVDEALAIAKQIAEALEAAHDKGVVHRDLKPGNVMVTPDGVVKVLDFGLARAEEAPSPPSHASTHAPTAMSPAPRNSATNPGVVLGSPGYMSPEQAVGKVVDKRSDVFAFGCVLYEMLAGVQVFPGETFAASLGAILHVEPDWSRLPANTPIRIRELLASTLHKDRKQRLHDIGDARLTLEHAIQGKEWVLVGGGKPSGEPRHAIARVLPWALAATFFILAAVASWRVWSSPRHAHIESSRSAPIRVRVDDPEAPPYPVFDSGTLAVAAVVGYFEIWLLRLVLSVLVHEGNELLQRHPLPRVSPLFRPQDSAWLDSNVADLLVVAIQDLVIDVLLRGKLVRHTRSPCPGMSRGGYCTQCPSAQASVT